ncbi:dnaJ homolog subfamily C member 24 isoform X3 [Neoarius graeffei]|nr:dnaJ homolog subfamily C member 24 isoform X3 [Neoarius graeffei]XP_060784261.1 dnaJ homolog subfamily C member 24 isoform X3 [Neoarius graeffei]XP_060784262.1 dnaJ homolog subfamily C member 24 isoform X3 [Neoarius graeffei]
MSNARDLEKNWYSILGATSTDDFQELKQKYQRLVLMFHPDKQQPGLSEEEAGLQLQRFIDVDQAWKILSNEESRREFDLQLRASSNQGIHGVSKEQGHGLIKTSKAVIRLFGRNLSSRRKGGLSRAKSALFISVPPEAGPASGPAADRTLIHTDIN